MLKSEATEAFREFERETGISFSPADRAKLNKVVRKAQKGMKLIHVTIDKRHYLHIGTDKSFSVRICEFKFSE